MIQAGLLLTKATLIVSAALVGCRCMRRRRAAVRHAVMASAFGVLLVLPIASHVGPSITLEVPVEPARIAVPPSVPTAATAANPLPLEADSATLVGSSRMPSSAASTAAVVWVVWAIGALLCLLPMLAGSWRMRSLRRCGRLFPLGDRLMRDVAADAGIRRRVDVLLHEGIASPVTYGALRPVIALPLDAETWAKPELERAIVHELEHVRRADWLTQCLARTVCAAYWFHPLVWIAWRRLVLDAERACDDAVLRLAEPTAYADQLVVMAARGSRGPGRPMLAMAGHDDLGVRVRAILDSAQERGRAGAACMALTLALAVAVVAVVAPVRAVAAPPRELVLALEVDAVPIAANAGGEALTRERLTPAPARFRTRASAGSISPYRQPVAADVTDASRSETTSTEQSAGQRDAATPATTDRRMTVLLFDIVSMQPDEMQRVIDSTLRWVGESISSSDMVAVVTLGSKLTVLSDFTFSSEKLLAALQSPELATETAAGAGTLGAGAIVETLPEAVNNVRLRALVRMCNTLAPIQQTKRILYFSNGMRTGDADSQTEVRNATDACNRANTLVYPVDARGLVSAPDPNDRGGALFRGR